MVKIISDDIPWLVKGTSTYKLFTDPPAQPPIPKYILSSLEPDDASPQRRIASRGTELFVATGCEIRCVDLRILKAQYETEQQSKGKKNQNVTQSERGYQVLDIPGLDFKIQQLEISPEGSYLAIVGQKKISVCLLPLPGFARQSVERLRCHIYSPVGTIFHNDSTERIVRTLWHPFGETSLVILTADAIIRVYDMAMDRVTTLELPDQTFDLNLLSGRERHRTSFTPDPESFEPASCCFGSGDLCWRPFTIYVLMRNGDIYALCPVVPSRWLPSSNYLLNLQRELSSALDALGDCPDVTASDRLALRQQRRWLEDVLNQQVARRGTGGWKEEWFVRPDSVGPTPKLQGPFLLQPPPIDTSADEVYACDITHKETDPVATIATLWSNANIDIYLECEPISAQWVCNKARHKQVEQIPSVIATFETIELKSPLPKDHPRKHWPVLVEDPLAAESFFVAHYAGVEAVDMSEWLKGLRVVVDENEADDFIANKLQRSQGSTITNISNSGKTLPSLPHPIVGCVILQDPYIGYIALANSVNTVHVAELEIPFQMIQEETVSSVGLHVAAADVSPSYTASIAQPLYDATMILDEPPSIQHFLHANLQRNPRLMRGKIYYNAESLEVLRQAREQVKREYEKITTVAETLYARAKQQKVEYERQLLKIHELITRQNVLASRGVKERLAVALKNQEDLIARVDKCLMHMVKKGFVGSVDGVALVKSAREMEWEEELRKIVDKTGFVEEKEMGDEKEDEKRKTKHEVTTPLPDGLAKRADRLRKVLEGLQPLMEQSREGEDGLGITRPELLNRHDGVPHELRKKKLAELNEMLEKEAFLVETTRKKLVRLEEKCEEVGL